MLSAKTHEERLEAKATLQKSMNYLESDLKRRQSKFFHGNDLPGMLDYMIWPWMERIDVVSMVFPQLKALLPPEDFPLLVFFFLFKKIQSTLSNFVHIINSFLILSMFFEFFFPPIFCLIFVGVLFF